MKKTIYFLWHRFATKLWFIVEIKQETCEMCPLEMFSPTVRCNHAAWQAAILIPLSGKTQTVTMVQSVRSVSFNICLSLCHMFCDNPVIWKFELLFMRYYDIWQQIREINSREQAMGEW